MKRFIDYRTLDKENNEYAGLKIRTRYSLEIETPSFQGLADVLDSLSRGYECLDVIKIENLDFNKIVEEQCMEISKEEERRGRHWKKRSKKPVEDELEDCPF